MKWPGKQNFEHLVKKNERKFFFRLKKMVENTSKRSSLEDSRRDLLEDSRRDLSLIESQMGSSMSTARPLEHPSRPTSRTNGTRRSASAARVNQLMVSSQPQSPNFESERLKTPDDDSIKYTVKQMNLQLIGKGVNYFPLLLSVTLCYLPFLSITFCYFSLLFVTFRYFL